MFNNFGQSVVRGTCGYNINNRRSCALQMQILLIFSDTRNSCLDPAPYGAAPTERAILSAYARGTNEKHQCIKALFYAISGVIFSPDVVNKETFATQAKLQRIGHDSSICSALAGPTGIVASDSIAGR